MLVLTFCLLLWSGDEPAPKAESTPATLAEEPLSVTRHSLKMAETTLDYTVTAGRLNLNAEDGTTQAQMFFIAYTLDKPSTPAAARPITFSFNGGPGSSSVWLHLGLLGPRRVPMDAEGRPLPPPYQLIDNPYTHLDQTDLVFIDPVSTGFSRAADKVDPKTFHGIDEDINSVGEFIRLYLTRNQRWSSPKFLIGESYGTTRAAGLVNHLQEDGIYFNGVILVSTILNFMTARFDTGNDLPYPLFLPTYTATAHYHGKIQGDLTQLLAEAEAFAMGPYTLALMKGDQLPEDERQQIAGQLEKLTGLSRSYILGANLRINIHRFVKELLRGQRQTVGRLDSRLLGSDRDASGEENEFDPSYTAILGPYTGAFNAYVRGDLGYQSDLPYEILNGEVQPWSFGKATNRYVNVGEDLRVALTVNPSLKVLVASGLYDLATPYFAAEYTLNHLQLAPERHANITSTSYPAGHMMYTQEASLIQLKKDLDAFYSSALPKP